MAKKIKGPGRPEGAPNKATGNARNKETKFRCSEGFIKVRAEIADIDGVSRNDVLHEALRQYAYRHKPTEKLQWWIDKI